MSTPDGAHLNNIRTELVALNANLQALIAETRTANLLAYVTSDLPTVPQKLQMKAVIVSRLGG